MRYYLIHIVLALAIFLLSKIRNKEKFSKSKFKIEKNNIEEDIETELEILNDEWIDYRLGDIVKGYFLETKNESYLNKIKTRFYGSLGDEYLKLTNYKPNIDIFFKLIKEKSIKLDNLKICYLHLRLGDVIDDDLDPEKLPDRWSHKSKYNYSYEKIKKLCKYLKYFYNLNEITIIGGAHRHLNLKKSLNFFNNVKNIFKDNKIIVNARLGNNPDDDLLLMCNSKIFIKACGGFSKLIADYVRYNNNIVIDLDNL